jgi:hypothetical protein
VPSRCHRRNAAEVETHNFKAHFLSILAGTADDFPKQLWDKLLPQAEITVNLLLQSNATPKVSVYAHMSGPFDYLQQNTTSTHGIQRTGSQKDIQTGYMSISLRQWMTHTSGI